MAITNTWKIIDLKSNASDGGITLIKWSCVAKNQTGTDGLNNPIYGLEEATESGKLITTYNASLESFIPYNNLTENNILTWVWEDSSIDKNDIETKLNNKIQSVINNNSTTNQGLPW
jgi:hypothetical protein